MNEESTEIERAAWSRYLAALPPGTVPETRDRAWFNILEAVAPGKEPRQLTVAEWRRVRWYVAWYARSISDGFERDPSPDVVLLARSLGHPAL